MVMCMSRGVSLLLLGLLFASGARATVPVLALDRHVLDGGSQVVRYPDRRVGFRTGAVLRGGRSAGALAAAASRRQFSHELTGRYHPFGNALRVSLGLREDANRLLLRVSSDPAELGSGSYAPIAMVGLRGSVADGLTLSGDVGLVGHTITRPRDRRLVTPIERNQGVDPGVKGYRPIVQLSADYRF